MSSPVAAVITQEFKTCPKCRNSKPGIEFEAVWTDQRLCVCGTCAYKVKRNPIVLNIEKRRKYARERILVLRGITSADYEAMLERQGGKCAICRGAGDQRIDVRRRLFLDHDHATGYARGLLCPRCNTGLGQFKDSKSNLLAAVKYLEDANVLRSAASSPQDIDISS